MATITESDTFIGNGLGTIPYPYEPKTEDCTNEFLAEIWRKSVKTRAKFVVLLNKNEDIRIGIDSETPTLTRIIGNIDDLSKDQKLLLLTAIIEAKDFLNLDADKNYEPKPAELSVLYDYSEFSGKAPEYALFSHAKKAFEWMKKVKSPIMARFDDRVSVHFDPMARRAIGRPIEIGNRPIGNDVPKSLKGMDDWYVRFSLEVLQSIQKAIDEIQPPVRGRKRR